MAGKEAEVIAEYNAFLLQNGRGDYNVLFDEQYVLLYYCLPIGYAQLYPEQYYVRGACALYDAIGRTITTVNACHAQLTESKRPKTYLFIRTNGGDNASLTYTKKRFGRCWSGSSRSVDGRYFSLAAMYRRRWRRHPHTKASTVRRTARMMITLIYCEGCWKEEIFRRRNNFSIQEI